MPKLAVSTSPAVPALIASAGDRAAWRFLEFFTVNIRNANTRAAYGRAAAAFLRWCEARHSSAARRPAGARRGLYRAVAGTTVGADRQAAPGRYPDAL
jgi:hypothetical protein